KSRKRPCEAPERNPAIHHWIILDIRKVIQSDEVMPDHLRIDPERHYRQPEQDENVGSLQRCSVADLESFRSSFVGCGRADTFSLLRGPFSHVLCESWLGTPSLSSLPPVGFSASQREFLQKTAKETKVGIGFATFFVIFVFFSWIRCRSRLQNFYRR